MNFIVLIFGITIAVFVIYRFKKRGLERTKWTYPLFLATFPLYYLAFALYGLDYDALMGELIVGSFFVFIALIAYKYNNYQTLFLLGSGYIAHAVYDIVHEDIFHNKGTPKWWPEFCGSVDIVMGGYIIYLGILKYKQFKRLKNSTECA